MDFWLLNDLDLSDPLNMEIWSHSVAEQEKIQPYRSDWQIGEIGAQQAMRFPFKLPWVPDPVGLDWDKEDAVLIVGSAYGPFIGGDGRKHEIPPHSYACETCEEFGRVFFEKVIRSRPYYSRISELASGVIKTCRLIALFDLCRVAFVRRAPEHDKGGDGIANCAPELFTRYVESSKSNEWLWRRVIASEARTILALGTVAEHGVLRLFARNLQDAVIRDSVESTIIFERKGLDHRWPARYANRHRMLKTRKVMSPIPFWKIDGRTAAGFHRTWNVAVVPHPTGARGDFGSYPIEALREAYKRRYESNV
ncbi:MAG: hypothetical protein AABO57_19180 [Acidobacteriota bacterium]